MSKQTASRRLPLARLSLAISLVLLACIASQTPLPPGITASPGCQVEVTAKRDAVSLNGSPLSVNAGATRMDPGANLALTNRGLADLKYGAGAGGHKLSLYAPQAGSSEMQVTAWNGTRQIAINAGAGYVVETAGLACKLDIVALGTVQINATGTEFAFSIDPLTGNGSIVVFDGSVLAADAEGTSVTVTAQRGVGIFGMRLGSPFEFEATPGEILTNLETGLDPFGAPLRFTEQPEPTEPPAPTEAPRPTEPPALSGQLMLWSAWSNTAAAERLIQAANDFMARNPAVVLEINSQPGEGYLNDYTLAVQAGVGPDLLITSADWGPKLYRDGLIADVTGDLSRALMADLTPAARTAVLYRGVTLGFPLVSHGIVLYRNRQIFPEPFDSFDALIEAAKGISINSELYGFYFDTGFFYSAAHLIGLGGQLMDEDGFPRFNDDWGGIWLGLLSDFQTYGAVTHYSDDDYNAFVEGQSGFLIDTSWRMEALRQAIGAESLAIDPWPTYQEGRLSGFTTTEVIFINPHLDEANRAAALAFVTTLLSSEVQANLALADYIPVNASTPIEDEHKAQIARAMQGNTPLPILPAMDYYWFPVDQAIQARLYNIDTSSDLNTAAEEISAHLKEYPP